MFNNNSYCTFIFQKAQSHISMVCGLVSQIPQVLVAQKHFQGTRGTNQCTRVPAHISTRHATVYSTFFSARHVLGCNAVFLEVHYVYQDQLATASSLTDTLKEIQESMRTFHEDINCLKASGSGPPSWEQSTTTPRNNDQHPAQRIPGTSWAEEMDILDPILDEQASDEARVVEVSPCTKACIMVSFHSMPNSARRSLQS